MTLLIPNARPRTQLERLAGSVEAAIDRVIDRAAFTPGQEVASFERAFATTCGTSHAVGTASGGAALMIVLLAAGIESGDEVLSVPNVDIAASAPISHTGADLRWVDIDPSTHGMDPAALEARIGSRTRAVVIVHMYGYPARMDELLQVARRRGLIVIEDASLAPGASVGERPVGSLGDAAAFSLSATKPLNALGKAGAITTDNGDIAERARVLANYGFDLDCLDAIKAGVPGTLFQYRTEGYNAGMDELQAAVLNAKLPALSAWVATRRRHAERYRQRLQSSPSIEVVAGALGTQPAPRTFTIRVAERDRVLQALLERGIASSLMYVPPLHQQSIYADKRPPEGFPQCDRIADELLCLPCYPELDEAEVDVVADAVLEIVG